MSELNKDNTILFWGTGGKYGFLSNFYPAEIEYQGFKFTSSEHLFMWLKAKYFKDDASSLQIVGAKTPKTAKALGRQVRNFNQEQWDEYKVLAMTTAVFFKFKEQPLREMLLETEKKVLVEASPRDCVWGIGLGSEDPDAYDPDKWKGQNLLGLCLETVRHQL
jgi:ribA/ribD-fused uncharacterized protein